MKSTSSSKEKYTNNTSYSCMEPRGSENDNLLNGDFSLKYFVMKIILGIVGGILLWSYSPSLEVIKSGKAIESLKIWPLFVCVLLLIAGGFGIYDFIKLIKEK